MPICSVVSETNCCYRLLMLKVCSASIKNAGFFANRKISIKVAQKLFGT
jgi:hypothetical protein